VMAEINFQIGDHAEGSTGQRYTLLAIAPYRNGRTGRESVVLLWRSNCRRCGAEFTCKTGPTAHGGSVHCPAHRLTREEARRLGLAAMHTPEARRKSAATQRRLNALKKLL
jgi:hypothetical protein